MNEQGERTTPRDQREAVFTGRCIAPGLGLGRAWVVGDVLKWSGAPQTIGPDDVDHELRRLKQSVEEALADLDRSAARIEFEFNTALAGIFRAHGMLLRDVFTSGELEQELRTSLLTAEAAVRRVFQRWYKQFEAVENPVLRERDRTPSSIITGRVGRESTVLGLRRGRQPLRDGIQISMNIFAVLTTPHRLRYQLLYREYLRSEHPRSRSTRQQSLVDVGGKLSNLTHKWAVSHGCAGCLRKPIGAEDLLAEVRCCLG